MVMRMVVAVMLSVVAGACSDGSSAIQASSAPTSGEDDPVPAGVILAAPTTVEIALGDEARQRMQRHLERGSLDVVRLIIENLRPRSAQGLKGVRIFLEKPDAGPRTPTSDPHFAGAFVLGFQSPETLLLNVAPAVSRLLAAEELRDKKTLRVTFVPDPADPAAGLPKDFALTFERVRFELPDEP